MDVIIQETRELFASASIITDSPSTLVRRMKRTRESSLQLIAKITSRINMWAASIQWRSHSAIHSELLPDFIGFFSKASSKGTDTVQEDSGPTDTWSNIQGSAKRRSPGLVNIVAAVAHHFCLALPAAFTQPGLHLLAEPYKVFVIFRIFSGYLF